MKVIFLGTPDFAVNVLEDLIHSRHQVVAVITQPDKPVGRSSKLQFPPVKECATFHNIPVYQFERIKNKEAIETLKSLNADIMITVAYGQILSQKVLEITPYGVYNVHGSLLPKYRGAAPIQWAIINGEEKTGITIMKTDVGLDSGDMLLKQEINILKTDTAETLFERMSIVAGDVLLKALDLLEQGDFTLTKQNEEEATHFPMLKKEDGYLSFHKNMDEVMNQIRGMNPWPVAYTYLDGSLLKVFQARDAAYLDLNYKNKQDGEVLLANSKHGLVVKVANGVVRLEEIQIFGGKRMSDTAFLNGKKIKEGTILS